MAKPATAENPLARELVDFFGGSRREAAEKLNRTAEAVRLWLRDGIPLDAAWLVEEKTQKEITAQRVFNDADRRARSPSTRSLTRRATGRTRGRKRASSATA